MGVPWLQGIADAFTLANVLAVVVGSLVGLGMGVLPGLGGVFGLTIFVPLTLRLPTGEALGFLVALYTAAVFGGAITAVLFRIPGHPGNIATTFTGPRLARAGRAGEAIVAIGLSGVVGGLLAVVVVGTAGPVVARLGVKIAPVDFFMLAVIGLALVAAISGKRPIEGLLLAGLGVLLSTVGADPSTGQYRFTGGIQYLQYEGINFAIVSVGLFGIGSVLFMAHEWSSLAPERVGGGVRSNLRKGSLGFVSNGASVVRGAVCGAVVGVVPGVGITVSNVLAYIIEEKLGRRSERSAQRQRSRPSPSPDPPEPDRLEPDPPEQGGETGARSRLLGLVMAPEAADNATLFTELIPALTLGIPGAPASALILFALEEHGLQAGLSFFQGNVNAAVLFILMGVSVLAFTVLGILLSPLLVRLARVRLELLVPVILVVSLLGSYAVNGSAGDMVLALIAGVVGYGLYRLELPLAPVILGVILGPLAEQNFTRTIIIDQAQHVDLFLRPDVIVLGLAAAAILVVGLLGSRSQLMRTVGDQHGGEAPSPTQTEQHGSRVS